MSQMAYEHQPWHALTESGHYGTNSESPNCMRVSRHWCESLSSIRVGTRTPGCEYPLGEPRHTPAASVALELVAWHSGGMGDG